MKCPYCKSDYPNKSNYSFKIVKKENKELIYSIVSGIMIFSAIMMIKKEKHKSS